MVKVFSNNHIAESTWRSLVDQPLVNLTEDCNEDADSCTGLTLLMHACQRGHLDIVKYLVQNREANVRTASAKQGVAAIHLACQYGHVDVVDYLLSFDPLLVKLRNVAGATPLAYAVHYGQSALVKFLVEVKCVDIEEIGANGKTPLMEATSKSNIELVEYFVSKGADFYARQPKTGNMAAHFAAKANCCQTLRFFLDRKPDMMIVKNYKGQTLIDIAHNHQVLRLLEDRGARRRFAQDF